MQSGNNSNSAEAKEKHITATYIVQESVGLSFERLISQLSSRQEKYVKVQRYKIAHAPTRSWRGELSQWKGAGGINTGLVAGHQIFKELPFYSSCMNH